MTEKDRLEYAKSCLDRFVEVYKARLGVWTVMAVATTTLTGFGVQFKQPVFFAMAGLCPLILLLLDYLIKRHYAAPFLYVGVKLEYQILGAESAALLFIGNTFERAAFYRASLGTKDEEERQRRFVNAYVSNGAWQKIVICAGATGLELLLAWRL